jgi:DNA adenine methylase
VPYGHKPERFSKAYVTKIVNQVKYFEEKLYYNSWEFLCQNFEDTIRNTRSNCFIYCDPPYIGRHVDYYDDWEENREKSLHKVLLENKRPFMVSTWDNNTFRSNPFISEIWSDCFKVNQEHFYYVGAKEDNRNAMTEAILTNYIPNVNRVMLTTITPFEQLKITE